MATIKEGYSHQPLEIKVYPRENGGMIEIWTEMFDDSKFYEREVEGDSRDDPKFRTEVLHYATLNEALQLRDELNDAIRGATGL